MKKTKKTFGKDACKQVPGGALVEVTGGTDYVKTRGYDPVGTKELG